ncbi:uncharacterized protein [Temnothorax longispinosus]|uniref:uncharacterized protein n=1 Tax=Temnothorax longispinosus TaxID=300112 RepID=UPI003A99AAD5
MIDDLSFVNVDNNFNNKTDKGHFDVSVEDPCTIPKASFLHSILHHSIRPPKSHIKDSWSFVREIKDIEINTDEVLVSLDVTALFTNIPKELVLRGIEKRWLDISGNTKLNLPQFLHAIELVLGSTSFSFNGDTYEQIFGSPMGSPLSPILADVVMEDLETHCLAMLNFSLSFFRRYVDDVIAVIPKDKIGDVLDAFNNYHPRLKFTHELEVNGAIPFLDTLIIKNGNRLLTNWHRKPTFSGRYVNYFSNHPLKYKYNTITSLVDHAILLSDKQFHNSNIKIVKDILRNNCFPEELIDKQINNRLKELKHRNNITDCNNVSNTFDARKYIALPYIKGLSEDIRRTVNRCGLDVLYTIPKKLDSIIKRGKDKLENMKETGVVYKIECNDCNASYIGQTLRHLETRVKEHLALKTNPPHPLLATLFVSAQIVSVEVKFTFGNLLKLLSFSGNQLRNRHAFGSESTGSPHYSSAPQHRSPRFVGGNCESESQK